MKVYSGTKMLPCFNGSLEWTPRLTNLKILQQYEEKVLSKPVSSPLDEFWSPAATTGASCRIWFLVLLWGHNLHYIQDCGFTQHTLVSIHRCSGDHCKWIGYSKRTWLNQTNAPLKYWSKNSSHKERNIWLTYSFFSNHCARLGLMVAVEWWFS